MMICRARQLYTPLPLGAFHIEPLYGQWQPDDTLGCRVWAAPFFRSAKNAFCKRCDECPISTLVFNKADFAAQEAFAGSIAMQQNNFFLTTILFPRVTYTDYGAVLGIEAQHCVCNDWHLGIRARIPVRSIKTKQGKGSCAGKSIFGGTSCKNFLVKACQKSDGKKIKTFAYRLDFLSQLPVDSGAPGNDFKIVDYHNTSFVGNPITISNQDATDNPALANPPARNPVSVIKSEAGTVPPGSFAIPSSQAQALPALPGNGNFGLNNTRARFVIANDYTPLGADSATQEEWWVVPSTDDITGQLVPPACIIEKQVDAITSCIACSGEAVFQQCGLNLCSQTQTGFGDLDFECFAQHFFSDHMFLEGLLGIGFPTGHKMSGNKVFALPLGNNGHFECKIGGYWCWQASERFSIDADLAYTAVLSAHECVSASFVGAQIKNLGPLTNADIAWNYYLGHINAYVHVYSCNERDCTVGLTYELYHKGHDDVHFSCGVQKDCIGNTNQVDAAVIEKLTKVTSHKVGAQLNYTVIGEERDPIITLVAGYNQVVAGSNVPEEKTGYLGVSIRI